MRYKLTMITLLLTMMLTLNGCQPQEADANWPESANPLRSFANRFVSRTRSKLPVLPFVSQGTPVTLQWDVIKGPQSGVTISEDGTVTMTGGEEITIRSRQTLGPNFFFEVTLPADFGKTQHLPYIGLDPYPVAPQGTVLWGINNLNNLIRVDSQSATFSAQAGDRIAMEAQNGTVRYYKNYSGPGSTPFYVSRLPTIQAGQSFPITLVKMIGVGQTVAKVKLTVN